MGTVEDILKYKRKDSESGTFHAEQKKAETVKKLAESDQL